jgi:hypothetical protein
VHDLPSVPGAASVAEGNDALLEDALREVSGTHLLRVAPVPLTTPLRPRGYAVRSNSHRPQDEDFRPCELDHTWPLRNGVRPSR